MKDIVFKIMLYVLLICVYGSFNIELCIIVSGFLVITIGCVCCWQLGIASVEEHVAYLVNSLIWYKETLAFLNFYIYYKLNFKIFFEYLYLGICKSILGLIHNKSYNLCYSFAKFNLI